MITKTKFEYTRQGFYEGRSINKEMLEFKEQIGAGSFGKVYKVCFWNQSQNYALKVLSKNQLTKLNLLSQLKNEIEILKSCDHPNIVTLHAIFEDYGYIFILT